MFSTIVHGGLAYDWLNHTDVTIAFEPPVEVTFLPVSADSAPVLSEVSKSLTETLPIATKPITPPPAKAKKLIPRHIPVVPEQVKRLPVKNVDLQKVDLQVMEESAGLVCIAPQDVVPESLEGAAVERVLDLKSVDKAADVPTPANRAATTLHAEKQPNQSGSFSPAGDLVDAVPKYRSNPVPEYPYLARQKHWEGVVWLLVDVSEQGNVADLSVEQSCGYRVLDRAASKTVRRWQFTPAKRAGLPAASQVRIPVRFRLEDG